MQSIPLFSEINDLHQLTGSALRTQNPLFHCFDMAETNDLSIEKTTPHRVSFYTLALNFGTEALTYTLNSKDFAEPQNFILCVAPGQIAHWEKQGEWRGYCTFFKSEFLQFSEQMNFLQQYPFFNISETNLIPLDEQEFQKFKQLFALILQEQQNKKDFAEEIILSYFQSILWQVRRIYEYSMQEQPSQKAAAIITAQFQYLINEHFLERTSVDAYADLLNISANHLSQTIKKTTGRTAKSLINQRRLNEAKYLLTYTSNNISEIAYHLNFQEATHFTKFFKKATAQSPMEYRENK